MGIINAWLMRLGPDFRTATWYIFIALLVVITCTLTGHYCSKIVRSQYRAIICSLLAFISFVFVILVALFIEKITDNYILLSGVTYYIPYILCASYILSKYVNCSFLEMADLLVLSYLPARAVNIIGCTVAGCCQGIPVEWGLYSAILKENVVPVQLYESCCIFAIWFILKGLYKRNRFVQHGRCAVYSTILFGGLNVFTDIFTYIQPKIVYMVSVEGVFAFLTMCTGLISLYIFDNKSTKQKK